MVDEQNLFKNPIQPDNQEKENKIEENNFFISKRLLTANNLEEAKKIVAEIEQENFQLEKEAREEWQKFGLNEQELVDLFDLRYQNYGPDEEITLRDFQMEKKDTECLKSINDNQKMEQSSNRLRAITNNFSIKQIDPEILEIAKRKGDDRLIEIVQQNKENQLALNQFNHLEMGFINRLAKGDTPENLYQETIQLVIDRENQQAQQDLVLGLKLGIINADDLEKGFMSYFDKLIKPLDVDKFQDKISYDHRQKKINQLHQDILGSQFNQSL